MVPRSPGVHIKTKIPLKNNHHAEGMAEHINKRDAVGTNIGCYYKCKECAFKCATRAACVAHACSEHTNKMIGPCDYCWSFYAHSAYTMKHHVNECAGNTTSSYDTDDYFFFFRWLVCSLRAINIIVNKFSTIMQTFYLIMLSNFCTTLP